MSESIEAKVQRFIQFNREMIAAAVVECERWDALNILT